MMKKYFNVSGACNPTQHYMIDLESRLEKTKNLIMRGEYFTINKPRQYGKTTILTALSEMLSNEDFETENDFIRAFMLILLESLETDIRITRDRINAFKEFLNGGRFSELFPVLQHWCENSTYPIVLIIDEIDSISNYDILVSFLAQLRAYFNARSTRGKKTFQSVILTGVYDMKNLEKKLYSNNTDKSSHNAIVNPWNIATNITIDMNFNIDDISSMLEDYEEEHHTDMNIPIMTGLLYDYTSGYPFLVSKLCKIIDEQLLNYDAFPTEKDAWTPNGFSFALKILLSEKNTLFETMINKMYDYPQLREYIYNILFTNKEIAYNLFEQTSELSMMFGFIKNENGIVKIANKIFEMVFYEFFKSVGKP